jgi:ABC-type uncharacterized transport system involved in gliding motility auxiliary subunit
VIGVSRATRQWVQLGVQIVLLLLGVGCLQVVADRTNRRFDLTPGRSLSLSPVTRRVLAEIRQPLRVMVFYQRGARERYAALLERFRAENRAVEFELLDLDRYPERARSLGVSQYGRAAIEYGEHRAVAPAAPEEELAGGILRAVRGTQRRLAFTGGHGERTPGGGDDGYGRLAAALASENYAPDGVSLLDGPVSPGTDLLVVAGPRHDFVASELAAVAAYLRGGGGVLLLLDPGPLPNLQRFLAGFGIRLGDDLVVDRERRILDTDGLAAVVEHFKRGNPVTEPLDSAAVLPSARSVDVAHEVPGVRAESVARTGATAWAVSDAGRARRGDEPSRAKHDAPGPASLVVIAEVAPADEAKAGPGRLVVVGDADFATDAYLDVLGNRDLALNAVAWLAGESALAGERTKKIPEIIRPLSPLVLTAQQGRAIFLGTVVVQPLVVLTAGLVVVGVRRRRG